jgi:hypothetical protein
LTEKNDQKPAVRSVAVSEEPSVRADEETFLVLRKFPQLSVAQALLRSTADVLDVVTSFNLPIDGPPRDVFIDKYLHFADSISTSEGIFSSSANAPA